MSAGLITIKNKYNLTWSVGIIDGSMGLLKKCKMSLLSCPSERKAHPISFWRGNFITGSILTAYLGSKTPKIGKASTRLWKGSNVIELSKESIKMQMEIFYVWEAYTRNHNTQTKKYSSDQGRNKNKSTLPWNTQIRHQNLSSALYRNWTKNAILNL